jgi:hypothetical protein
MVIKKPLQKLLNYIILLLCSSLFSSCENGAPIIGSQINDHVGIQDTIMNISEIKIFESQVSDYFSTNMTLENFDKIKNYTPSFMGKCTIQSFPELDGKVDSNEVLEMVLNQTMKNIEKMRTMPKWLNSKVKKPIRTFLVDNSLFTNADVTTTYLDKSNNKKIQMQSNIVCILEGSTWRFLDKDGCRVILECQFGKEKSDSIMSK